MKFFTTLTLTLILSMSTFSAAVLAEGAKSPDRIVSIGGSLTEIIYALGEQSRLIARDTTSTFPPEANLLPDIGYIRALSPEGVLSVDPKLVIALEGAGPPEAVKILQAAEVPFVSIPEIYSRNGIVDKILAVGEALLAAQRSAVEVVFWRAVVGPANLLGAGIDLDHL